MYNSNDQVFDLLPDRPPSAPVTQWNPKKRGGGHVAGSASRAPKREYSHYVHVELSDLKVDDRVQIKNVFAPYHDGGQLIDEFVCVRVIGRNGNRTLVLEEMEKEHKTVFHSKYREPIYRLIPVCGRINHWSLR